MSDIYETNKTSDTYSEEDAYAPVPEGAMSIETYMDENGVFLGKVYTDNLVVGNAKISVAMIEELVVGQNVQMGENSYISWGQITDKPFIPQTAGDVGALPINSPRLTYIDANGIYTGTISANQITAGTISADRIYGGTLTGVEINVNTNATVGNNLYLGDLSNYGVRKSIYFNNMANISGGEGFAGADIAVNADTFYFGTTKVVFGDSTGYNRTIVDFSRAYIIGLNDIHVSRVYASSGALKYDEYNYFAVNPSGAKIFVGGNLKASWSSIPKIRLDADGDGIINDKSFGANNPASMQPLLMDFIPVKANGRTKVYLDENFVAFVGGYDVFVTGGQVIEKHKDYFVFEGNGDFTCLVIGIQRGKEDVVGYKLVEVTDGDGNKVREFVERRITRY